MSVLIVEDHDYLGAYLRLVLQLRDIEARNVLSAEEAWEAIAAETPRLLLTDMNLPGESGLDLVRRLKADPDLCTIPVVAMTADDEQWSAAQLREAGCVGFLVKPVLPEALLPLVARHLPKVGPAD